jgi:hypothetical protein
MKGIEGHEIPKSLGIMGRYGLPTKVDVEWIRVLAMSRPLLFLGDMDPVDLMVFIWLSVHLDDTGISYLGIGDRLLDDIGARSLKRATIPLSSAEIQALTRLKEMQIDITGTVGRKCMDVLYGGYKFELEAIASAGPSVCQRLMAALTKPVTR